MGLPTQVDPNVKLNVFQINKERNRLQKMAMDKGKWKYAIECIGTLGQAKQIKKNIDENTSEVHNSIYALEDSGIGLTS